MPHEPHDEWTPEERAALERLPREASPSRLLEERTVTALRAAGVLRARARGRRWIALASALAASLALFLAGYSLGRRSSRTPADTGSPTATRVVRHVAWF